MTNKLPEGSYDFIDGKYICKKCQKYWSLYPCILLTHLRRKTNCQKDEEEFKGIKIERKRVVVEFK